MRCLFFVALGGCGGSPPMPDANTHTAAITPMVCTGGNPGDPTCPITHVDLGLGELQFYFQADPTPPTMYISAPKLHAAATGLYIAHPRFELWPDGAAAPTPNPSDPNATAIVNQAPNTDTVLTPTMLDGPRITFAYDEIGPHR